MTREEFEKLEDGWQTVYIDGRTPITMVSKESSKEDCILWYDDDECSHTIHYSRITLGLSDFEKELERLANKESLWLADISEQQVRRFKEGFKAGYRKAIEENARRNN